MWAIVAIRALVKDLYQAFLDMAYWCWNSWLSLDWLGDFFVEVYFVLTDLHYALYEIALWFESVEERITDVITESTIFQLLQKWLNYAEDAWYWVRYAWDNVVDIIWEWWPIALGYVKDCVDAAVGGLEDFIEAWDTFWNTTWPQWMSTMGDLKSSWDNFVNTVLTNLVSFTWLATWWDARLLELDKLINDTIKVWFPFYDDLVELWDGIMEFFNDPLEWLWTRFTNWFLGPEV